MTPEQQNFLQNMHRSAYEAQTDTKLEESVIGAAMFGASFYNEAYALVKSEDFHDLDHQIFWKELGEYYSKFSGFDVAQMKAHLDRKEYAKDTVTRFLLICNQRPSTAFDIKWTAAILKEKKVAREMLKSLFGVLHSALSKKDMLEEALKLQNVLGRSLAEVHSDTLADSHKLAKIALKAMAEMADEQFFMPTGIIALDEIIRGISRGMTVIGARTSQGKTAFAISLIDNFMKRDITCGVITLEMDNGEIMKRFLSAWLRHSIPTATASEITALLPSASKKLSEFAERGKLYADDCSTLTTQALRSKLMLMKDKGVQVIFIDYLQLLDTDDTEMRIKIVNITKSVKSLSKELQIPIVILSQMNRESVSTHNKEPQLHHLAESSRIENDADLVLLIHRPEFYGETAFEFKSEMIPSEGKAIINVAKNRQGRTGKCVIGFDKKLSEFYNLESVINISPDFGKQEEDLW